MYNLDIWELVKIYNTLELGKIVYPGQMLIFLGSVDTWVKDPNICFMETDFLGR